MSCFEKLNETVNLCLPLLKFTGARIGVGKSLCQRVCKFQEDKLGYTRLMIDQIITRLFVEKEPEKVDLVVENVNELLKSNRGEVERLIDKHVHAGNPHVIGQEEETMAKLDRLDI